MGNRPTKELEIPLSKNTSDHFDIIQLGKKTYCLQNKNDYLLLKKSLNKWCHYNPNITQQDYQKYY